jgi:hypothetical protein
MEVIFELVFEFFGEIILQVVFEALAEAGLHVFRDRRKTSSGHSQPWLAAIGYVLFGAIAGAISLWVMPTLFITSQAGRIANLVITPVASGLAMVAIGSLRKRRRGNEMLPRIDRFGFAFIFALTMALVRYRFGG